VQCLSVTIEYQGINWVSMVENLKRTLSSLFFVSEIIVTLWACSSGCDTPAVDSATQPTAPAFNAERKVSLAILAVSEAQEKLLPSILS
jgi:hypothetical protein